MSLEDGLPQQTHIPQPSDPQSQRSQLPLKASAASLLTPSGGAVSVSSPPTEKAFNIQIQIKLASLFLDCAPPVELSQQIQALEEKYTALDELGQKAHEQIKVMKKSAREVLKLQGNLEAGEEKHDDLSEVIESLANAINDAQETYEDLKTFMIEHPHLPDSMTKSLQKTQKNLIALMDKEIQQLTEIKEKALSFVSLSKEQNELRHNVIKELKLLEPELAKLEKKCAQLAKKISFSIQLQPAQKNELLEIENKGKLLRVRLENISKVVDTDRFKQLPSAIADSIKNSISFQNSLLSENLLRAQEILSREVDFSTLAELHVDDGFYASLYEAAGVIGTIYEANVKESDKEIIEVEGKKLLVLKPHQKETLEKEAANLFVLNKHHISPIPDLNIAFAKILQGEEYTFSDVELIKKQLKLAEDVCVKAIKTALPNHPINIISDLIAKIEKSLRILQLKEEQLFEKKLKASSSEIKNKFIQLQTLVGPDCAIPIEQRVVFYKLLNHTNPEIKQKLEEYLELAKKIKTSVFDRLNHHEDVFLSDEFAKKAALIGDINPNEAAIYSQLIAFISFKIGEGNNSTFITDTMISMIDDPAAGAGQRGRTNASLNNLQILAPHLSEQDRNLAERGYILWPNHNCWCKNTWVKKDAEGIFRVEWTCDFAFKRTNHSYAEKQIQGALDFKALGPKLTPEMKNLALNLARDWCQAPRNSLLHKQFKEAIRSGNSDLIPDIYKPLFGQEKGMVKCSQLIEDLDLFYTEIENIIAISIEPSMPTLVTKIFMGIGSFFKRVASGFKTLFGGTLTHLQTMVINLQKDFLANQENNIKRINRVFWLLINSETVDVGGTYLEILTKLEAKYPDLNHSVKQHEILVDFLKKYFADKTTSSTLSNQDFSLTEAEVKNQANAMLRKRQMPTYHPTYILHILNENQASLNEENKTVLRKLNTILSLGGDIEKVWRNLSEDEKYSLTQAFKEIKAKERTILTQSSFNPDITELENDLTTHLNEFNERFKKDSKYRDDKIAHTLTTFGEKFKAKNLVFNSPSNLATLMKNPLINDRVEALLKKSPKDIEEGLRKIAHEDQVEALLKSESNSPNSDLKQEARDLLEFEVAITVDLDALKEQIRNGSVAFQEVKQKCEGFIDRLNQTRSRSLQLNETPFEKVWIRKVEELKLNIAEVLSLATSENEKLRKELFDLIPNTKQTIEKALSVINREVLNISSDEFPLNIYLSAFTTLLKENPEIHQAILEHLPNSEINILMVLKHVLKPYVQNHSDLSDDESQNRFNGNVAKFLKVIESKIERVVNKLKSELAENSKVKEAFEKLPVLIGGEGTLPSGEKVIMPYDQQLVLLQILTRMLPANESEQLSSVSIPQHAHPFLSQFQLFITAVKNDQLHFSPDKNPFEVNETLLTTITNQVTGYNLPAIETRLLLGSLKLISGYSVAEINSLAVNLEIAKELEEMKSTDLTEIQIKEKIIRLKTKLESFKGKILLDNSAPFINLWNDCQSKNIEPLDKRLKRFETDTEYREKQIKKTIVVIQEKVGTFFEPEFYNKLSLLMKDPSMNQQVEALLSSSSHEIQRKLQTLVFENDGEFKRVAIAANITLIESVFANDNNPFQFSKEFYLTLEKSMSESGFFNRIDEFIQSSVVTDNKEKTASSLLLKLHDAFRVYSDSRSVDEMPSEDSQALNETFVELNKKMQGAFARKIFRIKENNSVSEINEAPPEAVKANSKVKAKQNPINVLENLSKLMGENFQLPIAEQLRFLDLLETPEIAKKFSEFFEEGLVIKKQQTNFFSKGKKLSYEYQLELDNLPPEVTFNARIADYWMSLEMDPQTQKTVKNICTLVTLKMLTELNTQPYTDILSGILVDLEQLMKQGGAVQRAAIAQEAISKKRLGMTLSEQTLQRESYSKYGGYPFYQKMSSQVRRDKNGTKIDINFHMAILTAEDKIVDYSAKTLVDLTPLGKLSPEQEIVALEFVRQWANMNEQSHDESKKALTQESPSEIKERIKILVKDRKPEERLKTYQLLMDIAEKASKDIVKCYLKNITALGEAP